MMPELQLCTLIQTTLSCLTDVPRNTGERLCPHFFLGSFDVATECTRICETTGCAIAEYSVWQSDNTKFNELSEQNHYGSNVTLFIGL